MDPQTIDAGLRDELKSAGIRPVMTDLAVSALTRDETGLKILGLQGSVAAFKRVHPELFSVTYRDASKPFAQIERERDREMRSRGLRDAV